MDNRTIMKNAGMLRATSSSIHHDLYNLRELIDLMERLLEAELKNLTDRVQVESESLTGEDREYNEGWYLPDMIQLSDEFPRIQRNAIFMTIMSMVENNLVFLRNTVTKTCCISVPFKKGDKGVIEASLDYLEQNGEFELNRLSERELILKFQKIRNAIVHNEGKPKEQYLEELRTFCKEIPTLTMDRHDYIIIQKGFLQMVLHIVDRFFGYLDRQMSISYKDYRNACSLTREKH